MEVDEPGSNHFSWLVRTKNDTKEKEPKSVDLASGFFFNINFIVGTGFLGVPYGFYRAGTVIATITLMVLSFISWNSANWIVETMSRAQAIVNWRKEEKNKSSNGRTSSFSSSDSFLINRGQQPNFELLLTRKFEASEMCELFFGPYMKYIYLLIFGAYMFVAYWVSATVAGSAWASNLPLNFGSLSQCEEQEFHRNLLPSGGCLSAYRFCVMLFAVIVIPLSLVELTEQKYLQVLLGLMRFFTFGCLVVYSVANLIMCPNHNPYNVTATSNTSYHDYGHQILKFDFKGWLIAIPIIVFAQILHQGIPSMTQPIKAKKWLGVFFALIFVSTTLLYMSVGITMSLWFKGSIQETATLNFVALAQDSTSSTALRVMAYYIVFFPSLDVSSAYPLGVFTISNNLFVLFTGSDSTELNKHRYGRLMLIALRLGTAILPIIASLFIANLVYVVKYAGLLGLFICYFFPIILQLRSQYVCHKTFAGVLSHTSLSISEELPLLASRTHKSGGLKWRDRTYYTPYSNIFSHPIIVMVFGVISLVACGLVIASLTVPH